MIFFFLLASRSLIISFIKTGCGFLFESSQFATVTRLQQSLAASCFWVRPSLFLASRSSLHSPLKGISPCSVSYMFLQIVNRLFVASAKV